MKKASPKIKISIIIPVYKVMLEYLRACFDSLAAQTLQECEFIIVSDGASDAEWSLCEEYAHKDSRFKTYKREHIGVSAARNYGIDQAQGEYVTFVDADDWIEPETCETTYVFAKKNNSDIVFWNLFFEEKNKVQETTEFHQQNINSLSETDRAVFQEYIIHCPQRKFLVPALTVCKLIRINCIESNHIRFDESLSRGEDRVFNFQVNRQAGTISYLNKTLYHYVIHANSTEQSFRSHEFAYILSFLQRLDAISEKNYSTSIAQELIDSFYRCIVKIYFSKLKIKQLYSEYTFLKEQIKKEPFHSFIQPYQKEELPLLSRIEIALMKRKITILFSLRIAKVLIRHIIIR